MALHRRVRGLSSLALLIIVPGAASAQDVDAMAKWTALTIVRYRVVGEYSGQSRLLANENYEIAASDRVELEFDWNQFDMKMAGEAKITNTPSRSAPLEGACVGARANDAVEIATALSVKDSASPGVVNVAVKSDTPAGTVRIPNDDGSCGTAWRDVAAGSATKDQMLQIMPAMMLAMGPNSSMVTPDGKSMFVKGEGWTWTFTPTAVR